MRIFSTAAVLIVSLGILTLTGCVEMQAVDVRPKSGALLIDSTDVLYVKDLLAQTASETRKLRYDCLIPRRQERALFVWYRIHPTLAASKPQSFGDRYQWAYANRRDDTQ
jgi:hypothetical protein